MKKIFEMKLVNNEKEITLNKIDCYRGKCGVWAMFDKTTGKLLEVAQTADIYKELAYDTSLLIKDYSNEANREKKYTARRLFTFSQRFDVLLLDSNRTTAKYRYISENYKEISVYVFENEEAVNKDKQKREFFEMRYAIDNEALFWNAYGNQRKLAKKYYRECQ